MKKKLSYNMHSKGDYLSKVPYTVKAHFPTQLNGDYFTQFLPREAAPAIIFCGTLQKFVKNSKESSTVATS